MNNIIHVLPTEVSNKIAAGEVVERPASVIKELVENSIDAGATRIRVEIKNGGGTFMRVTDNGSGMSAEDAQNAFLRHATSKISTADDLDAIYTFGFRGEALSSIGAVSEATIITKRPHDTYATRVECVGGQITSSTEAGSGDGTAFTVRNLFFNTPARMKFLKRDATEAGYISDIITRFILAHPEIAFTYISNGKEQLSSSGDGKLINAVYSVYGRDYAKAMIEVDYEANGIHVSGVVGKGNLSRPNRSFQSFFVNKRYIKSALMIRACEEAYKNQIMIGKFPVAVLNAELNPALIDINVHPTKLEVKFSDESKIYEAVYYGVKNALYALPNVPKLEINKQPAKDDVADKLREAMEGKTTARINPFLVEKADKSDVKKDQTEIESVTQKVAPTVSSEKEEPVKPDNTVHVSESTKPIEKNKFDALAEFRSTPKAQTPINTTTESSAPVVSVEPVTSTELPAHVEPAEPIVSTPILHIKIIGQVFKTYIIAQRGDDEMIVIDQHAAHERLNYERLLVDIQKNSLASQLLIEPIIVKLSYVEASAYEQNKAEFDKLGFESETFGENQVIIRSAPCEVDFDYIEDLFIELLGECMDNKRELKTPKQNRLLYTIACKAAIKANHTLTVSDMEKLTAEVLSLGSINTCPHGRPIMISMTKKELEKQFKRIV